MLGLNPPEHPLISIFNWEDVHHQKVSDKYQGIQVVLDFYTVSEKDIPCETLNYGRNTYDFDEGSMMFVGPRQVMSSSSDAETTGWTLTFHPELLRHTKLAMKMSEYTFFQYNVHEALYLSEKEKGIIRSIIEQIREEYTSNIDVFTKEVIVSQLELLFNYSQRFYGRQFITRTAQNSDFVAQFEAELQRWFNSDEIFERGLPTVKQCADIIGMSPDYLSDMLKQETGKSAQEHIHYVLIDRAKNQLLGTSNTVSEIAYSLGFEYPQYFSKLFKQKTGMTPTQFRRN
jgi:AraC-like DNA-binding protein